MKKLMKMLSIVMVVALAFTSVSFANLSQVQAKSAVKKVKVKKAKKNLTLTVGDKKTYKVKVKAKKGKTKFKVKSSNKQVVSVKKKGKKITLTALKAGKAKVTVRSKVDKKKKYVIKVTVKDKQVTTTAKSAETKKIAEPTVPAETTAEVVTNVGPTTEAPTDYDVTTEASTNVGPTTAAPTQEPATEAPTAVEPTTEAPTAVEPTTEAPTTLEPTTEAATEEATTEAPTDEETTAAPEEPTEAIENYNQRTVDVGESIDMMAYVGYEADNLEITSVENMPNTMTCTVFTDEYDDSYLEFGGTINTVGKYEIIVYSKDSTGQTYVNYVDFYAIDDEHIIVDDIETEDYVYPNDDITAEGNFTPEVYGKGNWGDYGFEIVSDPKGVFEAGLYTDEDGDSYYLISYEIGQVGTYTAVVKAYDINNPDVNTTFNITVEVGQYCKVYGTVKTASGKELGGAEVIFDYGYDYFEEETDEDGEYVAYMSPDRYEITAYYDDASSVSKTYNINEDKELNLVINDLYEVTITCDEMDPENFDVWTGPYEDEEGYTIREYGYGDRLLLPEGEYVLSTTGEAVINDWLCTYDAEITVNVTSDTTVKAVITDTAPAPVQSKELVLGENKVSATSSGYRLYKFVAPTDGLFAFTSDFNWENDDDTYAVLYDSVFNELDDNDDIYYDNEDPDNENTNLNFYLEADLEEGETYYVAIQKWDDGNATASGKLFIEQITE